MKTNNYTDKEMACQIVFLANGPYWHLTTPGEATEMIFTSEEEFRQGMTIVAMCCAMIPGIKVLAFQLMNNHIHFIVAGEEEDAREFFRLFKSLIQRYFAGPVGTPKESRRTIDWAGFECEPIRIPDIQALRNEICYTNRNGYVVRSNCQPHTYPWGSGIYYFNPIARLIPSTEWKDIPYRVQRQIVRARSGKGLENARVITLKQPGKARFPEDYFISADSFDGISLGERMFRDAHQYFSSVSKSHEANSEIAKRLGDKVFITDDEMFSAVYALCQKEYDGLKPLQLSNNQKIELARRMYFDYNASSGQIRRILKLDEKVVSELFPKAI